MDLFSMKAAREMAINKAESFVKAAESANRPMTAEENTSFDAAMVEANTLTPQIERIASINTLSKQLGRYGFLHDPASPSPLSNSPLPNGATQFVDMQRFQTELGAFMRGVSASDTPLYVGTGTGVESVGATIPTEVLSFMPAYYNLDSFALAGARQLLTDSTIPLVMPVVSGGAAASTYAEGAAPTESQPFQMSSFTFGGVKYSRLVKVSDEAVMNSAIPIQGVILDELTAGIATTFTAAITTAMLAALTGNSDVLVAEGSNDIYKTLGSLLHSIPPRFAMSTNKWMLSRTTLAKVKDQRTSTSGVPFFDPATNQIFQKDVVINDGLSGGQVVYGSWADGAIVRKSPLILLPLREKYSETGEVGFRVTQFLDQHFLAELSAVPNQPLYYTVLA